ncbi:MAG: hypothetical protein RLZZ46_1291 [Bacteroidota bacterium]|jgi:hypothetical protein
MNIKGVLKVKNNEIQVNEKFRKREFVLTESSGNYPQHIMFQLTQDRCSLLNPYNVGDEINVYFNLRGREWTSPQGEIRYFNTIEAWKIEGAPNTAGMSGSSQGAYIPPSTSEPEDLPF